MGRSLVLLPLLFGFLSPLRADVITAYTGGGASIASYALGESLTTPTGGPWSDLTFNFYDAGGNAYANNTITVYLLSAAYSGAATALSSSTTGYLDSTSTVSGNAWVFNPATTIQASTQYWVYMSTNPTTALKYNVPNTYSGGQMYYAHPNYSSLSAGLNFQLQGTVGSGSATPEPSTMLLCTSALGLLLFRRRRRGGSGHRNLLR
jgi:hypothetical protein